MSVSVRIPTPLRPLVGDAASVECAPGTVRELIAELESRYAGFAGRVTEDGALRRFVNVFVGGQDVRFAEGIDTPVPDGEEVTILPAVAGGAGRPGYVSGPPEVGGMIGRPVASCFVPPAR